MAIIDAPVWDMNGQKVFAYRYPQKNLSSNTQLNVGMSQEAIFVIDGKIRKKYASGRYTLDTANIPVMRKLFGLPFGGQNPCLAYVWYINKGDVLNVNCQTGMFLVKDPGFPKGCPLVAHVNYGLRVVEAEPFLINFVHDDSPFYASLMEERLKGRIEREITSKIAQYADLAGLSCVELNGRRAQISMELLGVLTPFVATYGLEFADLNVSRIMIDSSEEGRQIASGFGYDAGTFQQSRVLDIQEKAINNMASGEGGMLGALVAMGMMNNMPAQSAAPAYVPASPGNVAQPNQGIRDVYCSGCAKKFPSNMRFCPHCGNEYHPCPQCGSDNSENAKRCVNCGVALVAPMAEQCPHCSVAVPAGSAFCPACGHPLNEDRCAKCKTPLKGATYCPACGHKNK